MLSYKDHNQMASKKNCGLLDLKEKIEQLQ